MTGGMTRDAVIPGDVKRRRNETGNPAQYAPKALHLAFVGPSFRIPARRGGRNDTPGVAKARPLIKGGGLSLRKRRQAVSLIHLFPFRPARVRGSLHRRKIRLCLPGIVLNLE